MDGTKELNSWRVWLLVLLIYAVVVALFFVLAGSNAGFGALIGGAAGTLGAYLAISLMRRRGWGRRGSH